MSNSSFLITTHSLTNSFSCEFHVHEPLHVQIIFIDLTSILFIVTFDFAHVFSVTTCRCRHKPFLFGGDEHVTLWNRRIFLISYMMALNHGRGNGTDTTPYNLVMLCCEAISAISVIVKGCFAGCPGTQLHCATDCDRLLRVVILMWRLLFLRLQKVITCRSTASGFSCRGEVRVDIVGRFCALWCIHILPTDRFIVASCRRAA